MGFNPADPIDTEVAKMIRIKARIYARCSADRACDTEDIEQEVKLHLLKNGSKLIARRASQKTVLGHAIRNKILNILESQHARKRDRRHDLPLDDAPRNALSDGEHSTSASIDRLDVAAAIAALPDSLRDIAINLKRWTAAQLMRRQRLTRSQLRHRMNLLERHFRRFGIGP